MAFVMRAMGLSRSEPKKSEHKTPLDQFEALWNEFESFMKSVHAHDKKVINEAIKKHKSIVHAP
jgi:hypothetical protein